MIEITDIFLFSNDFPIVIYDGNCGFCNRSVLKILNIDKSQMIRFISMNQLPSPIIGKLDLLLGETNFSSGTISFLKDINSVVLLHKGKIYVKADAVLKIIRLCRFYPIFFSLFSCLPICVLNICYDFVSRNRYKITKNDACIIPDPVIRNKLQEKTLVFK